MIRHVFCLASRVRVLPSRVRVLPSRVRVLPSRARVLPSRAREEAVFLVTTHEPLPHGRGSERTPPSISVCTLKVDTTLPRERRFIQTEKLESRTEQHPIFHRLR